MATAIAIAMTRARRGSGLVILALCAAACAGATAVPLPVTGAELVGRTLHLDVGACRPADLAVQVEESATAVVITVTGVETTEDACALSHPIELGAPLDGRRVLEEGTGKTINVR